MILTDTHGRQHTYLRISLTEKCNLRCTYCMPAEGVPLTPAKALMTADELFEIATLFVKHGVTKIRLTGGEPLVRKDFAHILSQLASLPTELWLTTNAVLVDRYIADLKKHGVNGINVSLDTLQHNKFTHITRRAQFQKVYHNIQLLIQQGFQLKLNVVLIKGFNDTEIIDFIHLTKTQKIAIRFIEFMPFDGNQWDTAKMVSYLDIMNRIYCTFTKEEVVRVSDAPNDTSKNYKIKGYQGSFGIISSVTNPFCDSCNRIRLTANGRLKNCLFSESETDLLRAYRAKQPIAPLIKDTMQKKFNMRGGMDTLEKLQNPVLHSKNRSMITIGG